MNKAHWITVCLDGTVDDDKLKFLLEFTKNHYLRKCMQTIPPVSLRSTTSLYTREALVLGSP